MIAGETGSHGIVDAETTLNEDSQMMRPVLSHLVALGLAIGLPATTDAQTTSGVKGQGTSIQKPAPRVKEPQVPDGRRYWDHPDEGGAWVAWNGRCEPGQLIPTGAAGAVFAEWEKQLKAIAALVRACPVFKDIRGYYPQLSGCIFPGHDTESWTGSVSLILWPPVAIERTPAGEPTVRTPWLFNIPDALFINVNTFGDLGFSWFTGEDKEGKFYELPITSRELAGFPVIGGFLYVTRTGAPPQFTPLTQERAQRWIIDNMKRQAAADASILESARRQYEEFISPAARARREQAIE